MHVAVLGAGYAGLTLSRRLESRLPDGVRLTVIDERDTHLVQHLIHRVIREPALAEDLQIPLGDLLDRADHRQERVSSVDPEATRITLADGETLAPTYAGVCLGARTAFYDLPGVAEHGMPLKRVEHATAIRERFLEVCQTGGRIVVGGGGTSGVQIAGELAELADQRGAAVDITLLEQEPTLVPTFPRKFQRAVADELAARDVHVRTAATVEGAGADAVSLADGDAIPYDQFVWAGGIAGQRAMDGRRPEVPATLRYAPRTLALGDAATVVDVDGTAVPASAQTAMDQARVAATNLARLIDHRLADGSGFEPRLATYRYNPRGWLVSVGDGAVAQLGPTVLRGRAAAAVKETVGVGYLGSVGRVEEAVRLVGERLGGVG